MTATNKMIQNATAKNLTTTYKEVIEVLKYVPKESVDKLPKSMIGTFNKKMDINYTVNSVFLHIERGKYLGNIRF